MRSFAGYMVLFCLVCASLASADPLRVVGVDQPVFRAQLPSLTLSYAVFNGSGFRLVAPVVACAAILYAPNGSVAFGEVLSGDAVGFSLALGPGDLDLNTTRRVPFSVYCASNQSAGVLVGSFDLTNSGKVEPADAKLMPSLLALLPLVLCVLFAVGAFLFQEQEHNLLKPFFYLLSLFFVFLSAWLGIEVLWRYYDFPVLVDALGTFLWILGIVLLLLLCYFLIFLLKQAFKAAAQEKAAELEY